LGHERIARRKFIRMGAALSLGATGGLLAACGADSTGSGGGDAVSSVGEVGESEVIAAEAEIAPGSAVNFTDSKSGQPAVLVRLEDGSFVAYSAVCTHQSCKVAYRTEELTCPCHGSIFDPASGAEVVSGPAPRPLPEIPVDVRGGEVVRA
jgi:Rieske Fe-S protein